jgi:hypothetical protein
MTQVEKLVKIIMPDLLRYLEMVESGEIIEKRIEKNNTFIQKECEDNNVLKKKSKPSIAFKLGLLNYKFC